MLIPIRQRIKAHILAQSPEPRGEIEHSSGREIPTPDISRRIVEAWVDIEKHAIPERQFLRQEPRGGFVLFEGAFGDARLRVDEEEDLKADAADACAGGCTERVEELAQAVEIEGVAEEEGVGGVEVVFGLVVELAVDSHQLAGCAVVAHPVRAHGQGAVLTAGCEGVAMIAQDYHGFADEILVWDG